MEYVIPEEVLEHVIRKHGMDFSRVLGITVRSVEETS